MDHLQTKKIAGVVANAHSQKRNLTRKENKELKKINSYFKSLCAEFYQFLFTWDWDDPNGVIEVVDEKGIHEVPITEFNPFNMFNDDWMYYARERNNDRKHNTPVNAEAFHDKMINNENIENHDDITICNFGNPQLTHVCWII